MNNCSALKNRFGIRIIALVSALLLACSIPLHADWHYWRGTVNSLWSEPGNWQNFDVPQRGEPNPVVLVFPITPGTYNTTNDFTDGALKMFVDYIQVLGSGYTFGCLNSNINTHMRAGAMIEIDAANTLFGSSFNLQTYATNTWIYVATNKTAFFRGVIEGNGGIGKSGAGNLVLDGSSANTFSNTTYVYNGQLTLERASGVATIPAALVIGNDIATNTASVVLNTSHQIANSSDILINGNGTLDLNNQNDTIGSLTLISGDVDSGTGLLTLSDNVTNYFSLMGSSSINGRLSLGTASRTFDVVNGVLNVNATVSEGGGIFSTPGIKKIGAGLLSLAGTNTYRGQTTVEQGTLQVAAIHGLGTTNGGTTVDGGVLYLSGLVVTNEALTLSGSGNGFGAIRFDNTNIWTGSITLPADSVIVAGTTNAKLTLSGAISGSGGVTFTNGGTLVFSGSESNSYGGTTVLGAGKLQLGKSSVGVPAIPGSLVIGRTNGMAGSDTVQHLAGNQIANSVNVVINQTGLLDLNDFSDTLGGLHLIAGKVTSGSGVLTVQDGISTGASNPLVSTIAGHLALGATTVTVDCAFGGTLTVSASIADGGRPGGLLKTGGGGLQLTGTNTYTGATTVSNGAVTVYNRFALGAASGDTTVLPTGVLTIAAVTHLAEPLVLNGTGGGFGALVCYGSNVLSGPITVASDSSIGFGVANDFVNLSGVLSGAGSLIKDGPGKLQLSGSANNTLSSTILVKTGTLELNKTGAVAVSGPLVIGDGNGDSNADIVRLLQAEQIGNLTTVSVNSSGVLNLNDFTENVGSIDGSGNIELGTGLLAIGANSLSTVFTGMISGNAHPAAVAVVKQGTGVLTLAGTSTYSGETAVIAGGLMIDGMIGGHVNLLTGASLGGTGVVESVFSAAGIVNPGGSPGRLNTGNIDFGSNNTTIFEVNGTDAGESHDQLNVTGTVTLAGTLNVVLGFDSAISNQFVVLQNDGTDAISGTFSGLAEGATLVLNNRKFQISYVGGDGNDLALTQTSPITRPQIASIALQPGSHAILQGTGLPGITYTLEASTDFVAWDPVDVVTSDSSGFFQFDDTDAESFAYRFYRITAP